MSYKVGLVLSVVVTSFAMASQASAQSAPAGDIKNVDIENAWKDENGRLVIEFKYKSDILEQDKAKLNPDYFGTNLTFYGDGKSLYQLEQAGYGGSTAHHVVDFVDPRLKESGKFLAGVDEKDIFKETNKYELVCGDKRQSFTPLSADEKAKLLADIRSGKMPANPLPKSERRPEYLFKRKGTNQYIYVDADKYNYSYESFRMWVGDPKSMNERKIADVQRYRDGGTTYIKTADGEELFSPTAFSKDKNPTWNKMYQLERLDPSKFDLASLGIPGVPSGAAKLHTPCDKYFPDVPKTGGSGAGDSAGAGSAASPAK